MGRRTPYESITRLLTALMRRPEWAQSDLARHVGLTSKSTRRRLEELQAGGVPLERREDHPHVYWSVPRGWLPVAEGYSEDELIEALDGYLDADDVAQVLLRLRYRDRRESMLEDEAESRRRRHELRRWTPEQDEELERLYAAGTPMGELCERLDRSPSGIQARRGILRDRRLRAERAGRE